MGKRKRKNVYVRREDLLNSMRSGEWKTFIDSNLHAGLDIDSKRTHGYTLLSYAAQYGNKEMVEYLLQKGGGSEVQNCDGTIPLHIASKYNHQNIVELFINLGVFVDSRDKKNRTPLHCLAEETGHDKRRAAQNMDVLLLHWQSSICYRRETHMELANFLIVNGADLDAVDDEGNTPLLNAAQHLCMDVLKMLITRGANVQCCDNKKWTVLHWASYAGWLDIVQSLLERGIDVNATTLSKDTPLLFATRKSHKEIAALLIKSGANVHISDDHKMTALHHASVNGWLDVVQSLLDRGSDVNAQSNYYGNTPLMFAAEHFHRAVFDVLVTAGAHSEDRNEMTMLHRISKAGWLDVAQSLVENGSDVNAKTFSGDTPLLLAAEYSHKRIVDMLLKFGAIPLCCGRYKWTLLHYACKEGWMEIVKVVLEAGSNINAKTTDGETPLFIAAKFSHVAVFDHLVEAGADVSIKISIKSFYERCCDGNGSDSDDDDYEEKWSLLHHASHKGWLEVVLSLIKMGVDVNDRTYEGDTALHLALKDRDRDLASLDKKMEIVKHLLKAGADCNVENDSYETVFQYIVPNIHGIKEIQLFLENGAYVLFCSYEALIECDFFKKHIFQNVELCTQSLINQYNFGDLCILYKVPVAVKYLPPKERMEISKNGNVAQCIDQSVRHDIETNGYCNIVKLRPMALSLMCVLAFI